MILSERYKNLEPFMAVINTLPDNTNFTNENIAIGVYLKNLQTSEELLELIDNGDIIVLKGGAGTDSASHIVKVEISDSHFYFSATSSFLTELPYKKVLKTELHTINIVAKILITVSNETTEDIQTILSIPFTDKIRDYSIKLHSKQNNPLLNTPNKGEQK